MKKLLLSLSLLAALPVLAAESRSFAILSLAGDSITSATWVNGTGTKLDATDYQVFPLPANNTTFDDAAIRAASAALKTVQPDAAPFLMLTTDAELHQAQNAMFDHPEQQQANRDYLKTLWKDHPVSHLILITKYRATPEVKFLQQSEGNGKVEGLGFYMNNNVHVTSYGGKNNESSQGILMPYAYIKLRLIDTSTMRVVREVTRKESEVVTYPADAERAVRTWDALTPKQKTEYLDTLLRRAVTEGVPKLLNEQAAQ